MVRAHAEDMSSLGRPVSLAQLAAGTVNRVRSSFAPRSPFRIGDAVVGDDPFKGRREGVVVFLQGTSAGVDTANGVFFYDHRQLRHLD